MTYYVVRTPRCRLPLEGPEQDWFLCEDDRFRRNRAYAVEFLYRADAHRTAGNLPVAREFALHVVELPTKRRMRCGICGHRELVDYGLSEMIAFREKRWVEVVKHFTGDRFLLCGRNCRASWPRATPKWRRWHFEGLRDMFFWGVRDAAGRYPAHLCRFMDSLRRGMHDERDLRREYLSDVEWYEYHERKRLARIAEREEAERRKEEAVAGARWRAFTRIFGEDRT